MVKVITSMIEIEFETKMADFVHANLEFLTPFVPLKACIWVDAQSYATASLPGKGLFF